MPERNVNVEPEEPRLLSDNEEEIISGGSDDPANPVEGPTDPIPPPPTLSQGS